MQHDSDNMQVKSRTYLKNKLIVEYKITDDNYYTNMYIQDETFENGYFVHFKSLTI